MDWYIVLPVVFFLTSVIWVIVLMLYSMLMEPFDFGPLGAFALKSAILIFLVSLTVTFVPFGRFASLLVWWFGLMVIFRKDFWECRVLVVMIWGVNFAMSFGLAALFAAR